MSTRYLAPAYEGSNPAYDVPLVGAPSSGLAGLWSMAKHDPLNHASDCARAGEMSQGIIVPESDYPDFFRCCQYANRTTQITAANSVEAMA